MPVPVLLAVGLTVPIFSGAVGYVYGYFDKRRGRFPAGVVYTGLKKSYDGKSPLSKNQIMDYWSWYLKGVVQKKLKPFDVRDNPTATNTRQQPIVTYMVANLSAPLGKVRAFCLMLQMLVSNGKMSREFWDPLSTNEAKKAVEAWKKSSTIDTNSESPLANIATATKYAGIAIAGLLGLGMLSQVGKLQKMFKQGAS